MTAPPRIGVETGTSVAGLLVRAALALTAVAFTGLALGSVIIDPGLRWALAAGVGLVVGWLCAPPTPHVLVVFGGLALAGGPGPFDPVVLALLPLGHLVLRLAWWAAHVAPAGRLELRALIPDARRFVVLQAVLQVVGVALLLVAGTTGPPVLLALGGVALLALTVLLTVRRA